MARDTEIRREPNTRRGYWVLGLWAGGMLLAAVIAGLVFTF